MSKTITVFEHQSIKLNQVIGKVEVNSNLLHALQSYSGEKGVPYFSLIHNGIKFNEYVGVIQVGSTIIEVLPKADNSISSNADEEKTITRWRSILIGMLRAINEIDIFATSNSSLKIKKNSVLYLYFEIFIKEVEYLLHAGLVKKYRKKDGNLTTMKGKLLFGKNIQHNLVHQERFYVSYPTYDTEHQLHLILYKTILLIKNLNSNIELKSRIGSLLLHFPEMPNIKVSASIFEKLIFNRKTKSYKKAIDIAKLLLLNFHPDVVSGKNDVLALMFDMNKLWEKFVFKSLKKFKNQDTIINEQVTKYFWKPKNGFRSPIIPDIIMKNIKQDISIVLDTKWKNLNGKNPSPDDLKQMYVYHNYYEANQVLLIYPGIESFNTGFYLHPKTGSATETECSVICLSVINSNIYEWQKYIHDFIYKNLNLLSANTLSLV